MVLSEQRERIKGTEAHFVHLMLGEMCPVYSYCINCRFVDEVTLVSGFTEEQLSVGMEDEDQLSVGMDKSFSHLFFGTAIIGSIADWSLYIFESCFWECDIVIKFSNRGGCWSLLKEILIFVY